MNATNTVQAGQTVTGIATNGHRMTYRVVGVYGDGTPMTSQLDAEHSVKCPCFRREN